MEKNFLKIDDNKETAFSADNVMNKEDLGEGGTARVREVSVEKGSHAKNFALKDFKTGYSLLEDARKAAKEEFANYSYAKEAGLKVIPTLRISEDGTEIIETLLTNENYSLIGKDSFLKWEKVDHIDNIEDIFKQLEETVIKATEAKIWMCWDSYFFVIDKKNPTSIDFFIGDFGIVRPIEKHPYYSGNLLWENTRAAFDAIHSLVNHYIIKENKQKIYDRIKEESDSFDKNNAEKFPLYEIKSSV